MPGAAPASASKLIVLFKQTDTTLLVAPSLLTAITLNVRDALVATFAGYHA